ncbi:hypothetical protein G6M50_25985 [Agrobacterium rhizogenes]|nr:hypothetical protein [Rhizobium rhizogenes]
MLGKMLVTAEVVIRMPAQLLGPAGKRIIQRVIKRTDLGMVETRLINFQHRASLLCARHVFDRKSQGLGDRFETPVAKSAASAHRFARIESCSNGVVELGQVMPLRVPDMG